MEGLPRMTFVCVGNRVRSVFAEFFLPKVLRKMGAEAEVSSAGFVPRALRDHLARANINLPEPFFNRPMSELTKAALREKGITVPEEWRSKELSLQMVQEADVVITALGAQKEELRTLYKEEGHKIFSAREMAGEEGYLFFEDFSALPLDRGSWDHVEEDPKYVSRTLREWEQSLIRLIPNITRRLVKP
jgi:protein-tyrosine-phosphatase